MRAFFLFFIGSGLAAGCDRASPPSAATTSPHAQLAALDPRIPEALSPEDAWAQKQKMMRFLEAVEGITTGLANQDYAAVERSAGVLGPSTATREHCGGPSELSGRPSELSGRASEPKGIRALALDFRCRSAGIQTAARARDRDAVLEALSEALRTCNGCHAGYRQAPRAPTP